MRIEYNYQPIQKPAKVLLRCEKMLQREFLYISANSPKQAEILLEQFDETLKTIERMPTMGAIYKGKMRRMKLGKFRYYVYYRETKTAIEILGIWHTSKGSSF